MIHNQNDKHNVTINISGRDINTVNSIGANNNNLIHSLSETPNGAEVVMNDSYIYLANYGIAHTAYRSYRVILNIDNYSNSRPDFIKPSIEIEKNGITWNGNHFIVNSPEVRPDDWYKIEANDVKTNIEFFISNDIPRPGVNPNFLEFPDTTDATIKLIVNTRSGNSFEFSIPSGNVRRE